MTVIDIEALCGNENDRATIDSMRIAADVVLILRRDVLSVLSSDDGEWSAPQELRKAARQLNATAEVMRAMFRLAESIVGVGDVDRLVDQIMTEQAMRGGFPTAIEWEDAARGKENGPDA